MDNSIRQNELALEQHWRTLNPWFRVSTTVVGMTITDAILLAKHSAPSASEIFKMSTADWAGYVANDFFTMKVSRKARNIAFALDDRSQVGRGGVRSGTAMPPSPMPDALRRLSLGSMGDIIVDHQIKRTGQKSGESGDAKKRRCSMQAEGCTSTGADVRTECYYPGCLKKTTPTPNRFEDPQGVFICENNGCKLKHWREVLDLQSSAQTQTNSTT